MSEVFKDSDAAIKWLNEHCDLITSRRTHNSIRQYDFQTTDRDGYNCSVILSIDTSDNDTMRKGFIDAANRLVEHKK